MMQVALNGIVLDKRSGLGKASGKPYFMVEVGYMGGAHAFMLDTEAEWNGFPGKGIQVQITANGRTDNNGVLRLETPNVKIVEKAKAS